MKKYTVVGVYDDNKQTIVSHVRATGVDDAVKKFTAQKLASSVTPLCVFAGHIMDKSGLDGLYEE